MIQSKSDLYLYLEADARAHGLKTWRWWYAAKNPPLYFQRVMRRVEYLENCRPDVTGRIWLKVLKVKFLLLSLLLGFTIPPNTCGPGLVINHWGTIVISSLARLGSNCRLNVCINIGIKDGKAPVLGDGCYVGPGAVLFGGISLGNNVSVGANAVVNRSFPDGVTLVGVPARILERPARTNIQE